jgi:uncharacterized protein YcgI (DUF1989 family)
MTNEILIPGGHGGRIEVGNGQLLEIINVGGEQICDFFAFNVDDVSEYLSPSHCRARLRTVVPKIGDVLVTRLHNPIFEIVEDTVGRHDMTFPPCDPVRYLQGFGVSDHRSCRTNLAEVMADKNIPYAYLPDPINFFQNTPVMADGSIEYGEPSLAKAGDKVVLRAHMDTIAVGSACPMDLVPMNGERLTDIRFVVRDA